MQKWDLTGHPIAARRNVRTGVEMGAAPVIMKRTFPPRLSCSEETNTRAARSYCLDSRVLHCKIRHHSLPGKVTRIKLITHFWSRGWHSDCHQHPSQRRQLALFLISSCNCYLGPYSIAYFSKPFNRVRKCWNWNKICVMLFTSSF